MISELNECEKRKKNVVIYGVPESTKSVLIEKKAEDEIQFIGKSEIVQVYTRRLKSRNVYKPGPILVELNEASLRNPVQLAAKKLRSIDEHKLLYVSPDLTVAERELDFKLRQERNKMNGELGTDLPFRYGIRGNQLQKFKKSQ